MKRPLTILLAASLGLNAYCVFKHLNRAKPQASTANHASTSRAATSDSIAPPFSEHTWTLLKSGDGSAPDRLKALGFSDALTRALIRAEADKRYAEREKALLLPPADYWQRRFSPWDRGRAKDRHALIELRREKEAEIKRLLGDTYQPDHPQVLAYASFLPVEKAEQLHLLEEDYNDMQYNRSSYNLVKLPEDEERQRYLQQQRRADVVALLSPEELQTYDYRTSSTAGFLRYNLAGFNATEQEFQTLYALRKPLETLRDNPVLGVINTPERTQTRHEAEASIELEIAAALGESRYADYKRAQDYDYRTLTSLTKRLSLPDEKAIEGYTLKLALQQKAKAFQPQPGADEKQQRADFNATLLREAETAFTALYGEKGYAAIRDRIARQISPPLIR